MDKTISFKRVFQPLPVSAKFKTRPEDFIVDEHIAFTLTGEGEHCWLYIRKRLMNTDEVAQKLARFAGVKPVAIGYAGLKDKYAVSSQWFSVQLPGRANPDWHNLETGQLQILQVTRHCRKIQRGALSHNHFRILLRDIESSTTSDAFTLLSQRCKDIERTGVANYFGEQRFGHQRNNLDAAITMFQSAQAGIRPSGRKKLSRHKRSLYLSAARSWLFNLILSERVDAGNWDQYLPGDAFMLDGKSACFKDDDSADISLRLINHEIHPTGCLWGEGDTMTAANSYALEMQVINRFPELRDGLLAARVQLMRRALRLCPGGLQIEQQENNAQLEFDLPAGCYATVVLDEMLRNLTVNQSSHMA